MRVFNETQRFTQWFVWLMITAILLLLGYCCYHWYVLKVSAGSVSPRNTLEQLLVIVCLLFVPILFSLLKLKTCIDEKGIHYRFIPFHFSQKTILWSDMKTCYVREYNPIQEYGGWGYRGLLKNEKAYNVRGNKGIQIDLTTGRKVLIGTQNDVIAQQVIARYTKNSTEQKQ